MSHKKLLLADANFSCLPILRYLLSQDSEVAVCGNLATDPCHHYADQSLVFDYSNTDDLRQAIAEHAISYLVPGCNDASYVSCALAAEALGLPGYDSYDTTLVVHHKDRFRSYSVERGYPVPHSTDDENYRGLRFPVLVKPVDSFSGRGISKVSDLDELDRQYALAARHSSAGQVVVEEFVEGSLHSHSAFIKNGKIVLDFFVDEFCTVYPYQVNSSCLSYTLADPIRHEVRVWCEQLSADLSLTDGLVHSQFIYREGRFWVLEVTRRCPGDLYSELIRQSTGVDYAGLYAAPFLGIPLPDAVPKSEPRYIARHTASQSRPCVLHSTSLALTHAKAEFVSIANAGATVREAPFGKTGIYFIDFSSPAELIEYTPKLRDYVTINEYRIKGHETC